MQRRAILVRMRGKTNQSHHFFSIFLTQLSSIGLNSDHRSAIPLHQSEKKPVSAQKLPLLGLLLFSTLGASEPAAVEQPAPPTAHAGSGCGENGTLLTATFGSVETAVSWSGSQMICESMPRPNGEGVRLRFAGDIAGEKLAIIIAIPGMQAGEAADELPSNVTATVEGSGRFFSTPDLDSCWTDVARQTALPGAQDSYEVSGTLYCITPLGEVNGDAAVSIPELSFITIVGWKSK